MKITKKFLLELNKSDDRKMCSVRMNNDLYDFAKKDAEKQKMNFQDYMNNLLLCKILNDKAGKNHFQCLKK